MPPAQGATVAQRSASLTLGATPSEGTTFDLELMFLSTCSFREKSGCPPPSPLGLQHFLILSRSCQAGRKPSGRLLCPAGAYVRGAWGWQLGKTADLCGVAAG